MAQSLGLERYVPAFRDNEIDWEVLPKLTSEDLREIGVAAIGHRRKLLGGISSVSLGVRGAHLTFGWWRSSSSRSFSSGCCREKRLNDRGFRSRVRAQAR